MIFEPQWPRYGQDIRQGRGRLGRIGSAEVRRQEEGGRTKTLQLLLWQLAHLAVHGISRVGQLRPWWSPEAQWKQDNRQFRPLNPISTARRFFYASVEISKAHFATNFCNMGKQSLLIAINNN
ncbi:hypothetical protein LAZ67_1007820 [Cordylochernes scorpioides]|uniref:Uncharacterized protein n=1 Tax=Cordylochernes scorpioides TaxID=51811 RepID=A0ABY6K0P5_9ARAC|nr:hypothetical protein LAZ67_1007820 [Cordylochernes scorpioides]